VLPPNSAASEDLDAFSDFIGTLDMGDINEDRGDDRDAGDGAGDNPV
jgi:hypothetical protein